MVAKGTSASSLPTEAFIVFAPCVGLSLGEVCAVSVEKLPVDRVPTRGEWERLIRARSAPIGERIKELGRLELGLTGCVGCGCLSLDRCSILDPGGPATGNGPGWEGHAR